MSHVVTWKHSVQEILKEIIQGEKRKMIPRGCRKKRKSPERVTGGKYEKCLGLKATIVMFIPFVKVYSLKTIEQKQDKGQWS